MDCLQCKRPITKTDTSTLSQYICQDCWQEMSKPSPNAYDKPFFKYTIIFILSFACLTQAMMWDTFVSLPFEEKMLIQHIRLTQIENGQLENQYLTRLQAMEWRKGITPMVTSYAANNPDAYRLALKHAEEYIKTINVTTIEPAKETEFIKVGDRYVSKKMCEQNASICQQPVAPAPKQPSPPPNKRTPEQCVSAREKDWASYCYQMVNSPDKIDCDHVSLANKNSILDIMAKLPNTNQGVCLRGG